MKQGGNRDVAKLLMERGYSPGKPNDSFIDGSFVGAEFTHHRTPFHLAAARGHIELVGLFMEEILAMRRQRLTSRSR